LAEELCQRRSRRATGPLEAPHLDHPAVGRAAHRRRGYTPAATTALGITPCRARDGRDLSFLPPEGGCGALPTWPHRACRRTFLLAAGLTTIIDRPRWRMMVRQVDDESVSRNELRRC